MLLEEWLFEYCSSSIYDVEIIRTGCKQEAQIVTVWGLDQFYFFSSSSSLSIYDVSSYRKDGLRIFNAEKTWTQKQLFLNGQSNEISYIMTA